MPVYFLSACEETSIGQPLQGLVLALGFGLQAGLDDVLGVGEDPPDHCRGDADHRRLSEVEVQVLFAHEKALEVLVNCELRGIAWDLTDDEGDIAPHEATPSLCPYNVSQAIP